jgi:hypothetical protein
MCNYCELSWDSRKKVHYCSECRNEFCIICDSILISKICDVENCETNICPKCSIFPYGNFCSGKHVYECGFVDYDNTENIVKYQVDGCGKSIGKVKNIFYEQLSANYNYCEECYERMETIKKIKLPKDILEIIITRRNLLCDNSDDEYSYSV